MRSLRTGRLMIAAFCLVVSAGVQAAPGGGGGGMPSGSSSSFDPSAEYRKGIEALDAGKYAEAKKALDRVLDVAPRDANVNFLAGVAAAGLDDMKGARKYYERAVRADKEMVGAHRELGLTCAKLGDWAKARAELDRLKAMQQGCGAGCPKATEIGAAIDSLTAAIAGAPQARSGNGPGLLFTSAAAGDQAYLQAVSLINERRYEEALASLDAARATFGPHPDILTYQGFVYRKLGRLELAEYHYRLALAAAPGHRGATEYYGELMVERGDMAGARRMLASLDSACTFGCAEADELRRWIEGAQSRAR